MADVRSRGNAGVDPRYRVQSLGRAMDLLERIADHGRTGARLGDLAQGVGLSKPAAYSILVTLRARGLVTDEGEGLTKRYRLGLSLLRLGDLAVANTSLAETAMPILHDLTQAIGMTARVAVLDDGVPIVIARVDAPGPIRFDAVLGRSERLHCSGVGKVLLAAMPRQDAVRMVDRAGFAIRTPRTLTNADDLFADLEAVTKRFYALDDEEDVEGIICVAAGIFGPGGTTTGAVSVTTLKPNLPDEAAIRPVVAAVIGYADRIALALGGMPAAQAWATVRSRQESETRPAPAARRRRGARS